MVSVHFKDRKFGEYKPTLTLLSRESLGTRLICLITSNKFCPIFESTNTVSCSSGAFWCNNGQCIRSVNRCDGTRNCTDGSDETRCSKFHLISV